MYQLPIIYPRWRLNRIGNKCEGEKKSRRLLSVGVCCYHRVVVERTRESLTLGHIHCFANKEQFKVAESKTCSEVICWPNRGQPNRDLLMFERRQHSPLPPPIPQIALGFCLSLGHFMPFTLHQIDFGLILIGFRVANAVEFIINDVMTI